MRFISHLLSQDFATHLYRSIVTISINQWVILRISGRRFALSGCLLFHCCRCQRTILDSIFHWQLTATGQRRTILSASAYPRSHRPQIRMTSFHGMAQFLLPRHRTPFPVVTPCFPPVTPTVRCQTQSDRKYIYFNKKNPAKLTDQRGSWHLLVVRLVSVSVIIPIESACATSYQ